MQIPVFNKHTMKPGREQTGAWMALAMMYSLYESDRGLAIMESVLPQLNELANAAAKLDGYDHNYLRDGEWNMSSEGSVGQILTALAQNAGYFAWSDFDRAVSMTAQFSRPEIRFMARLKVGPGHPGWTTKSLPLAGAVIRLLAAASKVAIYGREGSRTRWQNMHCCSINLFELTAKAEGDKERP